MNELIKVEVNQNNEQAISMRELHEKLGIQKDFSDWFKQQVERLNLQEGRDFSPFRGGSTGGRPTLEYIVPLDIAKHICMISGGEKAHMIREYFIQVERAWNSPEQVMARALQYANKQLDTYKDKLFVVEQQIEQQKPLVMFAETCIASNDSILVRELAKLASKNGVVIGEKRLYKKLREWSLILGRKNEPSQRAMDAEWFEVKKGTYSTPYGSEAYVTSLVTPKGQVYIIERLRKEQKEG